MKQNDWLVATLNNPDYTEADFRYLTGLDLSNTQLLPKEEYLKSDYIKQQDIFKDDNGNFSADKFDEYYKAAAGSFNNFSQQDEDYQYSIWDVTRPKDAPVKDVGFTIEKEKNPSHMTIGIEGINKIGLPTKSAREYAQESKIYDPETGQYLDKSPNDLTLLKNPIGYFKSIFSDPLVYATYDQDTVETDPETGKQVKHKKGEYKVNEQGEYYTERLNGRSLLGKEVVSAFDYLTPEDSAFNKYDILDSDGLDSTVLQSVAKNLAAVAPLFSKKSVYLYAGLLIGRELMKTLPTLYGVVKGLTGSDETDSKLLNTIAAYGERMTTSTSDYARQNTFSFENFANLASEVAVQWGQQKLIAQAFSKLASGGEEALKAAQKAAFADYQRKSTEVMDLAFRGKISPAKLRTYTGASTLGEFNQVVQSGKWAESAIGKAALNRYMPAAEKAIEAGMRKGQDLSLVYMALISNNDVYNAVKEHGATPFEAAVMTLGSTAGMFSVDKFLGLGEMFFQSEPARLALKQAARQSADELIQTMGVRPVQATRKGLLGLVDKGTQIGKNAVNKFLEGAKSHTLPLTGKMIGEGLEEVSEEVASDMAKYLGQLAGQAGLFSQTDYGAGENVFERYMMSFLGGAVGGGIFGMTEAVRGQDSRQINSDLTYLLRQGKKDELLGEIEKLKDKGQLGSRNLSFKTENDKNGNPVYLTAENEAESQNTQIYNTLVKTINQLDFILNENGLNKTDGDLFDQMVQGEYRGIALSDFLKGNEENVKNISYITRYQQDFQQLTEKILSKQAEIDELNSQPDVNKRTPEFKSKLDKLNAEKEELLKEKEYLFGEGSLGYVEKMLFAMDTGLSGQFLYMNKNQYVRDMFGKSIDELSEAERQYVEQNWKVSPNDVDVAFNLYKELEGKINPSVQAASDKVGNWDKQAEKFLNSLTPLLVNPDIRLDDESDEEYEYRNKAKDTETPEIAQARISNRNEKVRSKLHQQISDWIDSIPALDLNQFRIVQAKLRTFKKNLIQEFAEELQISNNPELTHKIWKMIESDDYTDLDKLKANINNTVIDDIQKKLETEYNGRELYAWMDLVDDYQKVIGAPIGTSVTYGEMAAILNAKSVEYPTEDLNSLLKREIMGITDLSEQDAQTPITEDFVDWYEKSKTDIDLFNQKKDEIFTINANYLQDQLDDRSTFMQKLLQPHIDNILSSITTDPLIKKIDELEGKEYQLNPIEPVMSAISKVSQTVDINQFLSDVYQQYHNGENPQQFQLSQPQEIVLEQFLKDLDMARGFVHAAADTATLSEPVGHNKALNQFISNHKDVFKKTKDLPVIDNNYANYLINEMNLFQTEVEEWLALSRFNAGNKVNKFKNAETAYIKTVQELFRTNREAFKLTPHCDLLEGYEDLDPTLMNLAKIQQLLYNNYKKALDNGMKMEDILTLLIPKITVADDLKQQLTAKLDDTLTYAKLTSYDKFSIVLTAMALSPKQFYTQLVDFINANNNLAPLSIQEVVSSMVLAQQSDHELVNKALEVVQKLAGIPTPILYNTTIVTGLGGAGKSALIAKMSGGDGTGVWISGPTQSQLDNLAEHLPQAEPTTKEDLMKTILGDELYSKYLTAITTDPSGVCSISSEFGNAVPGLQISTVKLNEALKTNKIPNPPKLIVIDEATHFSTLDLEIISKFARENNIQVLLMGDSHQNGALYPGLMMNMNREQVLAWRTPDLYISLRDSNQQKSANMSGLVRMIDKLDDAFIANNASTVRQEMLSKDIPNFKFAYYNKESFKGEILVNEIPEDIIGKLTGTVGFIGQASSSAYQQLKNAGATVTLVDPLSVQGREFDYVVVDKNWDYDMSQAYTFNQFLQDVYTMTSRSREGTILIQNGELKRFSAVESPVTGTTSIQPAINMFRETRIPILTEIANTLVEYEPTNTASPSAPAPTGGTTPPPAGGTSPSSPSTPPTSGTQPDDDTSEEETSEEPTGGEETSEEPAGGEETSEGETSEGETSGEDTSEEPINAGEDNEEEPPAGGSEPPVLPPSTYSPPSSTDDEKVQDEDEEPAKGDDEIGNTGITVKEVTPKDAIVDVAPIDDDNTVDFVPTETPVRVYGDFHLSGIQLGLEWVNNGTNWDLNLFLPNTGQPVVDPKEKYNIVKKLLDVKSVFAYGIDLNYDRLPNEIKARFSQDAFENATYSVHIENPNPANELVGLTQASNDKRIINGKVVKLVATITDNDGKEWNISLGLLASPTTWKNNIKTDKEVTRKRINNTKDPKLRYELEQYYNNIEKYQRQYEAWINTNTATNKVIVLKKKPNFSGLTTILPTERTRLESLDNDFNLYQALNRYMVVSDVYAVMQPTELGVSEKMRGRAVVFASNNTLLLPSQLRKIYIEEKSARLAGSPNSGQVRMIPLDNLGVSFVSLFHKKYKDLYHHTQGSHDYFLPFEYKSEGVRMYKCMWNFRANLSRFLSALEEFKANNPTIDLNALAKLDSELYQTIGKGKKIIEKNYREMARQSEKWDNRIELLWKFNDSLSQYRQFRLGYSNHHGAYLRYLTNLQPDGIYQGKSQVVGIYINEGLAKKWKVVIDNIFSEVLDPLVNPGNTNVQSYMSYEKAKKFFTNVGTTGEFEVTWTDYDKDFNNNKVQGKVKCQNASKLALIPIIMTKVAKMLEYRALDDDRFTEFRMDYAHRNDDRYLIKIPDPDNPGTDRIVQYDRIFQPFEENHVDMQNTGTFDYSEPGIVPYATVNGQPQGIIDRRMETFWNFMFHGTPSTAHFNDFNNHTIRATDADFKNGFFVDVMLEKRKDGDGLLADVQTNSKLFGSRFYVGMPIIGIDLTNAQVTQVQPTIDIMDKVQNPTTSRTELLRILRDTSINADTLMRILRHPNVTDDVMKKILHHNNVNDSIAKAIINHARVTDSLLKEIRKKYPSLASEVDKLLLPWMNHIDNSFNQFPDINNAMELETTSDKETVRRVTNNMIKTKANSFFQQLAGQNTLNVPYQCQELNGKLHIITLAEAIQPFGTIQSQQVINQELKLTLDNGTVLTISHNADTGYNILKETPQSSNNIKDSMKNFFENNKEYLKGIDDIIADIKSFFNNMPDNTSQDTINMKLNDLQKIIEDNIDNDEDNTGKKPVDEMIAQLDSLKTSCQ